jgi:hypothetical protein
MTEIKVRREKPVSRWPWILVSVVLLLVLLGLWQVFGRAGTQPPVDATRVGPAPEVIGPGGPAPGAVPADRPSNRETPEQAFVEFARTEGRQEPAHPVTVERGLALLAEVVEPGLTPAAPLRAAIDSLAMGDWRTPRQTLLARGALQLAGVRLFDLTADPAATEAVNAARQLSPDRLLTAQAGLMLAYWDAARRAVEARARPRQ